LAGERGHIVVNDDGSIQFLQKLKAEGSFIDKNVFLAAALSDRQETDREVSFVLPNELMTGNRIDEIKQIHVDFDDGKGFRNIIPGEIVEVNYSTDGQKVIAIIAETEDKDSFKSLSTITIKKSFDGVWGKYGTIPPNLEKVEIEAQIPFSSPDGFTFKGRGELTYLIHNPENGLQKPVLVVNGFDPNDKIDDARLFSMYLNSDTLDGNFKFADELHSYGYDIVILNFQPWHSDVMGEMIYVDYIQRNAFVVAAAIDTINHQLTNNNSNKQLIVVGASMGGLTTRYALAYMEQNNINHNTRLWVSLDAPQKGANIPIGIQYTLQHFAEELNNAKAIISKKKNLDNPAARQMLLHYYGANSVSPQSDPLRNSFVSELETMGFPSQTRNISIVNGSTDATAVQPPAGNKATSLTIRMRPPLLSWYKVGDIELRETHSYGQLSTVFKADMLDPPAILYLPANWSLLLLWNTFINQFESKTARGFTSRFSLDNSPGGTRDTYNDLVEEAGNTASWNNIPLKLNWNVHNATHSFIPTKSALAFTGNNQDFIENISNRNLVVSGETPFDSYWAPMGKNMEHATLFDEELMCWLLNEINENPMPPSIDYQISGPTLVCNTASRFDLNNVPAGHSVSWSYSENLVTPTFMQKCINPCIYLLAANSSYSGPGWVQAIVSGPCGDVVLPPHDVWVGAPAKPLTINGFPYNGMNFGSNSFYYFSVSAPPIQGVNNYQWVVGGGSIIDEQSTDMIYVLTGSGSDEVPLYFDVSVKYGNACGISPWLWRSGYVVGGEGPVQKTQKNLLVNPNPSDVEITISEIETSGDNSLWELHLMNQQGMVMRNVTATLPKTISVDGLKPGIYILNARLGEQLEKHIVVVK